MGERARTLVIGFLIGAVGWRLFVLLFLSGPSLSAEEQAKGAAAMATAYALATAHPVIGVNYTGVKP